MKLIQRLISFPYGCAVGGSCAPVNFGHYSTMLSTIYPASRVCSNISGRYPVDMRMKNAYTPPLQLELMILSTF